MATTKMDARTGCKGGPAAKRTPRPVEPAKVLDLTLHNEIGLIAKSAQHLIQTEESGEVSIPADKAARAIDLLALSRQMVRTVKADYDARTKDIVDPFKPYATEKKQITALSEEIGRSIEAGLHKLVKDGLIGTGGYDTPAGTRLSLVGKRELVLDDPLLVPDEYLLPRAQCLDWNKIKTVLEANEKAVAAAKEAGVELKIHNTVDGAHLATTYTFRTKLPEELE
jgi:hypothetical protein